MKRAALSRYVLFVAIALAGATADLLTKHWIFGVLGMPHERPSWWLIDEIFGFTTSLNEGALFGIGQGQGLVFSALSLVAITGIVYWLTRGGAAHDLPLTVALSLIAGGIVGNLFDRLGLPGLTWGAGAAHPPGEAVHAVRDWLHFKIDGIVDWPIFNLADSLLVCGAVILIWHALKPTSSSDCRTVSATEEEKP
jgi:signal peptidase II